MMGLLTPGAILLGRYRIVHKVGQGGMAAVYKGWDLQTNQVIAIKEMGQAGLSAGELQDAIAAFEQEARLLQSLRHPHLPRVYNHFQERGHWYLTMDFIEGETLEASLHSSGGRLDLEKALDIGIQLCTVLEYLHRQHPPVIFRDLKPANVMRTDSGTLYLIDFGIARLFKPGKLHDTIAVGTPGYAAPEQWGKSQTDARADIYSLGAMLHELLTGEDPSNAPFHFAPVLLVGQPTPIRLQHLLDRMLETDRQKRISDLRLVRNELLAIKTAAGRQIGPSQRSYRFGRFAKIGIAIGALTLSIMVCSGIGALARNSNIALLSPPTAVATATSLPTPSPTATVLPTPTVTPVPPTPTAVPTSLPTWHTIEQWSGSGYMYQSPTFNVPSTSQWRIVWQCAAEPGSPPYFDLWINNASDGSLAGGDAHAVATASGITYPGGSGAFYLAIDSDTSWSVTVEIT